MAEDALKAAGYFVSKSGSVFDKKDKCIGYISKGVFVTQPVYELKDDSHGLSYVADIETEKFIESVAKELGLEFEESEMDSNLRVIRTAEPEKMPVAAKFHKVFTEGIRGLPYGPITHRLVSGELKASLQRIDLICGELKTLCLDAIRKNEQE